MAGWAMEALVTVLADISSSPCNDTDQKHHQMYHFQTWIQWQQTVRKPDRALRYRGKNSDDTGYGWTWVYILLENRQIWSCQCLNCPPITLPTSILWKLSLISLWRLSRYLPMRVGETRVSWWWIMDCKMGTMPGLRLQCVHPLLDPWSVPADVRKKIPIQSAPDFYNVKMYRCGAITCCLLFLSSPLHSW